MTNADLTSSVEVVYQRTRRAILTGDYAPGSPLRLQELAARSGVSMIPVREALRLLEAEGFVESVPNRGARVAPLSMDDMLDVYRTRQVLELEALHQAFPRITPAVLAKAHRLNNKIVRQFAQKGYAEYEDHRAFHFTLYEPSGSKWLMRMIAIVWDHTERYRRQGSSYVTPQSAREEHELILSRLADRDEPGAVEALRIHLERSVEKFTELFRDNPSLFTGAGKPSDEGQEPARIRRARAVVDV
ncbi:MAG: GntR family transcriptional regulator [Thermomicrobiales bacterium]|nr:GntR family transcriptional regulator [Thermomicrobiales bacterium]